MPFYPKHKLVVNYTPGNELIDMIGDTAKKIHTGRSRNDQVATDMRLYVRDEIIDVVDSIIILQKKIIKLAEKYSDSIMPGFTHLQVAQPVTFGFILMSWFFMLERDKERKKEIKRERDNERMREREKE